MPATIYIDMRCLQNPNSAERGIANHARNLVREARAVSAFARQARLVGLTELALPPLQPELAACVDAVAVNGYVPELPEQPMLLQLSPMTQAPLFLARLLLAPAVQAAAAVYDFIPHDDPAPYLVSTADRLAYQMQMTWLERYALYLPISAGTEARLRALMPAGRPSVVTGAAINPAVRAGARPGAARHILVIGANDQRKNAECAVRAHARSAALQAARVPLVVTGYYLDAPRAALFALARQCGGDAALLHMPGRVTQETLVALYRDALCVAVPSRAEGFSLPVVEAMAAGVPAVVSDIPEHAELVADAGLRFAPEDDARLGAILQRLAAAPEERQAIAAAGQAVWPRYTGAAVAQTAWNAIASMATALPAPSLAGGRKPRVALLSPLPPTRSGVADYTASTARALAAYAEVTLVPAEAVTAVPHLSNQFDRVVSVMGNSRDHHGRIFTLLREYGGACICHDARLMHFRVSQYGLDDAVRIAVAETGRTVTPEQVQLWFADEMVREASFLGPLTEVAQPLIFHSRKTAELVRARFGTPAATIPFAVYRELPEAALTAAARALARQRLGMAADEIHIASFGFVGGAKGMAGGLAAVAALNRLGIHAVLHWVGAAAEELAPWRQRVAALGLTRQVVFHEDYVSEARYRDYLAAADLGLQLRLAGSGNISGALQDCVTAGLPTAADTDLAETIEAPEYVRRVESDGPPELIAAALAALLEGGLHKQRDMAARAAYCADRSMDGYARRLCAVLGL